MTAAYYLTRTITVTNLLTPTFTNKHNDDFELYVTIDRFYKANATLPTKTPTDFIYTWLPPTISQERLQWRIHWHQLLQTKQTEWRLWTIRDNGPLLQSKHHTADENTDWLYLYVTAAYYFTRTITVTNSLTPTIANKTNRMTTLNCTWQKTTFTKHTALCRRKHRLTLNNTWLPPS